MNVVRLGPTYLPQSSIGRPIANADIYVGIPDTDPEIVGNQLQLYVQEEDGTIVAVAQPVSTGAGGVPMYNGSPVTLLVEGYYSLKILNSSGSQIYYIPSSALDGLTATTTELNSTDADVGFINTGLKIQDTDASHLLTIKPGSSLTADRTVTVYTGDIDAALFLLPPGGEQRAKFEWKDADEIYINPGAYFHAGTKNQIVYWNSQLILNIGTPTGPDWYYVYLDDSAIVTAGINLLTATEFIFSTTEPTWSGTKHGWYNGNDRCVFAIYVAVTTNNIEEFYHDGGDLVVANPFDDYANAVPGNSTSRDSVVLTIPSFCIKAYIIVRTEYISAEDYSYISPKTTTLQVQAGVGWVNVDSTRSFTISTVFTDASQTVDIWTSAGNAEMFVRTSGWYFPSGM